jgi:XTP/dITP diphosphohydrolase
MHPELNKITAKNVANKLKAFERLLQTMEELRALCPWDKKQDWKTLRPLTIEETYELADAILSDRPADVKEELGDILLHIIFYAKIGEEQEQFSIVDVIHDLCDKLVERHPHIYGDIEVQDEEEVKRNWEQIKLASGKTGVLAGVPNSLPSMVKAYRLQEKTAQVGFQWSNKQQVWAKLEEEMEEFRQAENKEEQLDELGDVFFSLINYARYVGLDPDEALTRTNVKFKRRFEFLETEAEKPLREMSLEEMDALWDVAKDREREGQ